MIDIDDKGWRNYTPFPFDRMKHMKLLKRLYKESDDFNVFEYHQSNNDTLKKKSKIKDEVKSTTFSKPATIYRKKLSVANTVKFGSNKRNKISTTDTKQSLDFQSDIYDKNLNLSFFLKKNENDSINESNKENYHFSIDSFIINTSKEVILRENKFDSPKPHFFAEPPKLSECIQSLLNLNQSDGIILIAEATEMDDHKIIVWKRDVNNNQSEILWKSYLRDSHIVTHLALIVRERIDSIHLNFSETEKYKDFEYSLFQNGSFFDKSSGDIILALVSYELESQCQHASKIFADKRFPIEGVSYITLFDGISGAILLPYLPFEGGTVSQILLSSTLTKSSNYSINTYFPIIGFVTCSGLLYMLDPNLIKTKKSVYLLPDGDNKLHDITHQVNLIQLSKLHESSILSVRLLQSSVKLVKIIVILSNGIIYGCDKLTPWQRLDALDFFDSDFFKHEYIPKENHIDISSSNVMSLKCLQKYSQWLRNNHLLNQSIKADTVENPGCSLFYYLKKSSLYTDIVNNINSMKECYFGTVFNKENDSISNVSKYYMSSNHSSSLEISLKHLLHQVNVSCFVASSQEYIHWLTILVIRLFESEHFTFLSSIFNSVIKSYFQEKIMNLFEQLLCLISSDKINDIKLINYGLYHKYIASNGNLKFLLPYFEKKIPQISNDNISSDIFLTNKFLKESDTECSWCSYSEIQSMKISVEYLLFDVLCKNVFPIPWYKMTMSVNSSTTNLDNFFEIEVKEKNENDLPTGNIFQIDDFNNDIMLHSHFNSSSNEFLLNIKNSIIKINVIVKKINNSLSKLRSTLRS